MEDVVRTWHYGVMARHWAENVKTGPEIDYFLRQIQLYGQPALDTGCGTGRLLIPFLRAGLDVDGCDVSEDMLAYCRELASKESLSPTLHCQALHNLNTGRLYQTIVACGVFGLGVSREQDFEALKRFYRHLQPGGVLLLENYLPYGDAGTWPLWPKDGRGHLPGPWNPPLDGTESAMHYRLVAVDPLEQQTTMQMRSREFEEGLYVSDTTYTITVNMYFRNELKMLLQAAGFSVEAEHGDWTDAAATTEHDVIVFIARK